MLRGFRGDFSSRGRVSSLLLDFLVDPLFLISKDIDGVYVWFWFEFLLFWYLLGRVVCFAPVLDLNRDVATKAIHICFKSRCISQCVEGVLSRGRTWCDANDHNNFGALEHERISQSQCQLRSSEGHVHVLVLVLFSRLDSKVEGPDAFFKGHQALIDLGCFNSTGSFVPLGVPFGSGKVYKHKLSQLFLSSLQNNGAEGVRSR